MLEIAAAEKMFRFCGGIHGLQIVSERNDRQKNDRKHGQRHDLRACSGQEGLFPFLWETDQPNGEEGNRNSRPDQIEKNFHRLGGLYLT